MQTKLTLIFTLLALTAILAGCGGAGADDSVNLDGTSWVLSSYNGSSPISGTEPTLRFEGEQASGNGSCNSFGGGYVVDGSSLTFSDLFRTEMYCMNPEGIMDQENVFLQMLGNAQSFSLEGSSLTILTAAGEELVFTPASE